MKIIDKIIFIFSFLSIFLTGCRDDVMMPHQMHEGREVSIIIDIEPPIGTKGIDDESKIKFEKGELIHIYADFKCESKESGEFIEQKYAILKYDERGAWIPLSDSYSLIWPLTAIEGSFRAYYMNGSTGAFTQNTMEPKLLSEYKYDEIPMSSEANNIKFGGAVRLNMKRLFSHLTLTELREGISDELWFTLPDNNIYNPENAGDENLKNDVTVLNNAFRFEVDKVTGEVKPVFLQLPSSTYKDKNGDGLVFVASKIIGTASEGMGEMTANVSFLLEPKAYQKFNLLYPRSRDSYSTYLSYGRDLRAVLREAIGAEDLKPNGRYVFSILRSLGVIIDEAPEDIWDKSDEVIQVDVEQFLRAVNTGSSYFVENENGELIQVLEQTTEGSLLLKNVDFNYQFYDVMGDDNFLPVVNKEFNGNYHYIHNLGCPLFYQNNATIRNLGIKNVDTSAHPLESSEKYTSASGYTYDNCSNGIITSRNYGTVSNVRISNIKDMTVRIRTTRSYEPSQEAHDVSLLFGVNTGSGNVYDLYLAGEMNLKVINYPGNDVIPRVSIGGLAGQNLGLFSGVSFIDEAGFEEARINIVNECSGDNGVYKIGGLAGNHTGIFDDIFISSVNIDSEKSNGLQSEIGGLVGDCPSSASGSSSITGCIIRGEIKAGNVSPLLNLESKSYAGGIAGSFNIQAKIENCSISVGVAGSSRNIDNVEYSQGGGFGAMIDTGYQEGGITQVSCFGSQLVGYGYKGNFSGIAPSGFDWSHYEGKDISVRKHIQDNIGIVR